MLAFTLFRLLCRKGLSSVGFSPNPCQVLAAFLLTIGLVSDVRKELSEVRHKTRNSLTNKNIRIIIGEKSEGGH
jgi:hypothetical protein